ncbi:chemotaxis protein CheW [Anaerosporomusa subterranea]|jgi:purine-binding chemotaxis protein CheW|uniref:Chemotaxis protein CheW n=1 Tax=Anaerosporomusa subterranea TaxID=1794912 RepID=A0A154BTD8_ANASB|nr:chemotaxis protein CheW [Anaerosporomusa subterranea]KYZ77273.1 chemotaxis protein CheW [Anaerosporomusa subterranea]MDF2500603.1 CheW protein [Anaerosporomusa subterranea]
MEQAAYAGEESQLVVFKLDKEEYGISILQVQEIKRMTDITRVPHTPDYIKGVINLRGSVLPVLDLKKRLGLPNGEYTDNTRIIIVNLHDMAVGLIVDGVSEVTAMGTEQIESSQSVAGVNGSSFISGVGKLDNRLLILLNLDTIIIGGQEEKVASL